MRDSVTGYIGLGFWLFWFIRIVGNWRLTMGGFSISITFCRNISHGDRRRFALRCRMLRVPIRGWITPKVACKAGGKRSCFNTPRNGVIGVLWRLTYWRCKAFDVFCSLSHLAIDGVDPQHAVFTSSPPR